MLNYLTMLFNKDIRKNFKYMHDLFKQDENYSFRNLFNTIKHLSKNSKFCVLNDKIISGFVIPPFPSKPFLTYITATKEKGNLYTQNALLQKTAPLTVSLGVTDRCGYNCIYCSTKGRKSGKELSISEWIKVIEVLQDMGTAVITFTGGEPLLRDDLDEMIRTVDDRSMTLLFTSAQGLTLERARELKKAGLYGATISIDSYDEAVQNARRGSEKAFFNAVNGIENSLKAGLYTSASCVASKDILERGDFFKILDFFARLNVNEIILIPPISSGNWLGKDEEMYTDQDRNIFLRLQAKADKRYKKIIISSELNNCSMTRFGCAAGINHSHINSYGELFPCDFTPLSFGNVRNGDIKTLWNNMRNTIDKPHCKCLADEVFPMIDGEELPVSMKKSIEICSKFKPDRYPDIYRKMLGE